jgi:hypothetical protein
MRVEAASAEGYAKVAELMNAHPELAIFRQFRTLNLQMLLYQQAEITHLENELRVLMESDIEHGRNIDHYQDWWTLAHDEEHQSAQAQWTLAREIQHKLEAYSMFSMI